MRRTTVWTGGCTGSKPNSMDKSDREGFRLVNRDGYRNGYRFEERTRSRVFNRTNAYLALAGALLLSAAFVFSPLGGDSAGAPGEPGPGEGVQAAAATTTGGTGSTSPSRKANSTSTVAPTPRRTDPG